MSELLIVFILSLPTDIGNIEMKRVLILSVDTPSEETRRRRDEGLMFPDICLMTGLASVGLSLLFIALRLETDSSEENKRKAPSIYLY